MNIKLTKLIVRGCIYSGLLVILLLVTGCPDSSGGNHNRDPGPDPISNKNVSCTSSGDDSTQNMDGSASYVQSHTAGSPLFHSVVTRKDYFNQDVTLHYMVHQPTGTSKGIVLLIAGGALTANINGTEGNAVTSSGDNFLVRSAHRFMQAGYRVITMDRPDDFATYGDIDNASYLYDTYRTSMAHAIDITTIVNRENSDNLPVFIAGTSRGAISAVAQNRLAMGIAISSPVTLSSDGGAPIGSSLLPVDVLAVPVHVLYHQDDGCSSTLPVNTITLINQINNAGVDVAGDKVSGGFNDTLNPNPCGAFSYHGYLGIENCAVNTTTAWINDLLSAMESHHPGNARPVALDQATATSAIQPIDINLIATDADDTNLIYQLPMLQSLLGGTLSITGSTVHYVPPVVLAVNTTDSFAFTVVDSKGSRSAAVVNIDVSVALPVFDHSTVTPGTCSTCHADDKPAAHIKTTLECDVCHNTSGWIAPPFDHSIVTGTACVICHDGVSASGKSAIHIPSSNVCDACHSTDAPWAPVTQMDHAEAIGNCEDCHLSPIPEDPFYMNHFPTNKSCGLCHSTINWSVDQLDHSLVTELACASSHCHDGVSAHTYKSATHPSTSEFCEACHITGNWTTLILPFNHSEADTTTCESAACHSAAEKSANHLITSLGCEVCHTPGAWIPVIAP